jgi:hypothetical protein
VLSRKAGVAVQISEGLQTGLQRFTLFVTFFMRENCTQVVNENNHRTYLIGSANS